MEHTEAELVVAAQAGDRRAVDELITSHLPLVYNVVGRALSGRPGVDDVVQETMLRALRDLPTLRAPERFRAWLTTIAVRRVSTHLLAERTAAARTAPLDAAAGEPDPGADFETLTVVRLGLSGQRRQAARAGRWLDPDNRILLSLWWLEAAGHLTRAELVDATGLSAAHAAVRVQRMRAQFELSRSVVAAIDASPRCAGLTAALAGWHGRPDPLWRKRIARHLRSCAACGHHGDGLIPAESLLLGLALVPVPVSIAVALSHHVAAGTAAGTTAGTAAAGAKAGLLVQVMHAAVTHPVLAVLIAGGLTAVTAAAVAVPSAQRPAAVAAGTRPPAVQAPAVPAGRMSLESANAPGRFVAYSGDSGTLTPVGAGSSRAARIGATFDAVPGLAGVGCVSFRSDDGRYLRHSSWRARIQPDEGTALFRGDATFCPRPGAVSGSTAWESQNYPGWFLRHVGDAVWVDRSDGSAAFDADSAFFVRAPLAD
ncbi:AbfB domain-containing protein [Virgisporangium aurantiacum]|uniref:RNA polymerase sigma factor n=1 Tax=Virgisporangium aurantiacum TaxID=175570 RepID=A0A8J4E6R6_9ACTN|nr:AbfB domain-containing protein [Virgisporangium aurantiacum]GIJ61107.1 hypothetical protein Vau01_086230 [Virgisporangium aurantiacum]